MNKRILLKVGVVVGIPMEIQESFLSYICGKLLGDGCFTLQLGRKPRLQFIHAASDFEWCNYCYQQLCSHVPLNPPKYSKVEDSRILKGFTERYMVQSKTSEIITYLKFHLVYKSNKNNSL